MDTNGQRVSVIVPVYNQQASISAVLNQLESMDAVDEIIVVDDLSSDKTVEIIKDKHPDIQLIEHPYRIGYGAAFKTGIRSATGDVTVLVNHNGQQWLDQIPELLEDMETYDMSFVVQEPTKINVIRRIWQRWYGAFTSYLVGYEPTDLASGLCVLRTETAQRYLPLMPNRISSLSSIILVCSRAGHTVKRSILPIQANGTRVNYDTLSNLGFVTYSAFLFYPLRIFIPLSVILFGVGMGGTILNLIVNSRFTELGGLLATIGVLFFMLGLVAEQVSLLNYME